MQYKYIWSKDVKQLIVIKRLQNKSLFTLNVCTVYNSY